MIELTPIWISLKTAIAATIITFIYRALLLVIVMLAISLGVITAVNYWLENDRHSSTINCRGDWLIALSRNDWLIAVSKRTSEKFFYTGFCPPSPQIWGEKRFFWSKSPRIGERPRVAVVFTLIT